MAKKKKNKKVSDESTSESFTSRETTNTILGILSAVLVILFILAAIGKGGRVGSISYDALSTLFGIGYYLLPIVFGVLTVSFFQSRERTFALPQVLGSVVLFTSALGIIGATFSTHGGLVGSLISKPFISLFDLVATVIIFSALIIISILIIFDTSIRVDLVALIKRLFSKEEKELPADADTSAETPENAVIAKAVEKFEQQEEKVEKPAPVQKEKQDKGNAEAFMPLFSRKRGKSWTPPPLSLLDKDKGKPGVGDIKANANLIKRTLMNFGIVVEMDEISIGPSVTRYALKPAEGVKLSKILGLQNNLELALAAHPVRIEAPIPGKSLVGIEVPNTQKSIIGLGSLFEDPGFNESDKPLLVSLGRDITGKSHFANLAKMPHVLIAGATGAGKSVTIHAVVASLLFRNPPENLKLIMIDPKRVELTLYNGIPHLLTPVITDPKKAILALKWAGKEMERRYNVLEENKVRDIDSYHKNVYLPSLKKSDDEETGPEPMPYIVVIVDELADLMQSYPREFEATIVRLAQMSRAVGIHLMLSTQRPSVNVITGLIKANIPARVALQVASQIDSRTILDTAGAEKLLGAGDMLYLSGEMSKPTRIQSAYISEKEVKDITNYLRESYEDELEDQINLTNDAVASSNSIFSATLDEDSDGDDDDMYEEARETVIQAGKASTSFLQRKLRVGYARAARLIDLLEERGIIGPGDGAKPRDVIVGPHGEDSRSSFGGDDADDDEVNRI